MNGVTRIGTTALVLGALLLAAAPAAAQPDTTVTPTDDLETLLNALLGASSGMTIVDGTASFIGSDLAIGTYTDGPQGISDGIVISSGRVENVSYREPQDTSGMTGSAANLGQPGHPLCEWYRRDQQHQ